MSLQELKKKKKKYTDDAQAIAELKQRKADAQAELAELEGDLDGDIDKLADKAAKANGVIQDADFRINALSKRQDRFKREITQAIKIEKETYRQYERDIRQRRRERAKEVIKSSEFQEAIETLKGLYAAGGFYSFDTLLKEAIPQSCDYVESRAIAERLGFWIDEEPVSPIIREAEQAIDSDREYREYHAQNSAMPANNSTHLVMVS